MNDEKHTYEKTLKPSLEKKTEKPQYHLKGHLPLAGPSIEEECRVLGTLQEVWPAALRYQEGSR